MITLSAENFGLLAVCAIRYCQGRQTYMPDLVRSVVKNHLDEVDDNDLAVMIADCEFQEWANLYGNVATVVRCKECKYYRAGEKLSPQKFCFRLRGRDGEAIGYNFAEDDFCSYGERSEDATD